VTRSLRCSGKKARARGAEDLVDRLWHLPGEQLGSELRLGGQPLDRRAPDLVREPL